MDAEERLRSKYLYKIELYLLKVIPILIALIYFSNIVLSYFNIQTDNLSPIGGISFLPWLFLYVSSFVFRFCIYHRMFLYYIAITEAICWFDYKVGIPISDRNFLNIHLMLFLITLILVVYFKFKK